MRLNILIGGKAGQGINKVSSIVSEILNKHGYFTFNYREYPSLIKGGHNFNVLSISDLKIGSHESKIDGIVAMDENTVEVHKNELKKGGFIISFKDYSDTGRNLNLALAGALIKVLGIPHDELFERIKKEFDSEALNATEKGYKKETKKFELKKLNKDPVILTGSQAIANGAINSNIDVYFAYPMTPATAVLHELAAKQIEKNLIVFQPENEIAVANAGLGSSFAGARTMIGTSGGGFDLMTEALSFQGMSEIPLVVYLASRPGPGTGIPTFSTQADLEVALYAGHGEFPRILIAPGDPIECIEKTNEAFYLSEKYGCLSIILSDKHLAESEFSSDEKPNKIIKVEVNRNLPGRGVVKASSYEHDPDGSTTESPETAKKSAIQRLQKLEKIKKEIEKLEAVKIHGKKDSKNLIVSFGSTKTAILDAIEGLDFKFMQVLYLNPFSDLIEKELKSAKKIIAIEQNATSQLSKLIRQNTGIATTHKILKFDGRPFFYDELKQELLKIKWNKKKYLNWN